MPWVKTAAGRARDKATYQNPEYLRNARTCKANANGRCQRCGNYARQLQADHIRPVSQGGSHSLANLQALCQTCHQAKTAREGSAARRNRLLADPPARPTTAW